ncbi:hypothetical protein HQN89_02250 [Paenibacillus frigoriresistens]|uniref:hypothetical protein n=1 Tax=Paenibacillus alginolyticus TaxID=59839 RepID=UPI00156469FD|nr:hypothetical protein [Paenibacillus frigoriresistens]NRF89861.1 hypothetical protein [Paenibacillus frigoriresistens]
MYTVNFHDVINIFSMAAFVENLAKSDLKALEKLYNYCDVNQRNEIKEMYFEVVEKFSVF